MLTSSVRICVLFYLTFLVSAANAQSTNNLYRIVGLLEQCNDRVIAKSLEIDGAKFALDGAKAQRLPNFSINAQGYLEESGNHSDPTSTVRAALPLFAFGRIDAAVKKAKKDVSLFELTYSSFLTDHIYEAMRLEIESREARGRIAVLEDVLSFQIQLRERIGNRIKAGLLAQSDMTSIKGKISKTRTEILSTDHELASISTEQKHLLCPNIKNVSPLLAITLETYSDNNGTTSSELRRLNARLQVAEVEVEVLGKEKNPILQGVAEVPVDDSSDSGGRVGLSVSYEYRGLGRDINSKVDQQKVRVSTIEKAIKSELRRLETIRIRIISELNKYSSELLPSQTEVIGNLRNKLASQERLFASGRRASLFELLSTYDELKQALLDINRYQADIDRFRLEYWSTTEGALILPERAKQ